MHRIAPFELQGHRGARALFPENTLEGCLATLALGVDTIELDVAVTTDGVAVVTHDLALNPDLVRGPDGAFLDRPGPLLRTLRSADLAAYDVGRIRPGSALAARFPLQAWRDGLRIPTLAAVFRATAACPVRLDVELKTDPDRAHETVTPEVMAACVLQVAQACQALDRLVVRSFDWRGLAALRRLYPALPLVWLSEAADSATLAAVRKAAGDSPMPGWAPADAGLTEELVTAAHAAGLRVLPWTVNDPGRMATLIGWGVDGVCTDDPVMGRRVMCRAGMPLPLGW